MARDRTEVDEDASKEAAERARREARRLCVSIVEKLAELICVSIIECSRHE